MNGLISHFGLFTEPLGGFRAALQNVPAGSGGEQCITVQLSSNICLYSRTDHTVSSVTVALDLVGVERRFKYSIFICRAAS